MTRSMPCASANTRSAHVTGSLSKSSELKPSESGASTPEAQMMASPTTSSCRGQGGSGRIFLQGFQDFKHCKPSPTTSSCRGQGGQMRLWPFFFIIEI